MKNRKNQRPIGTIGFSRIVKLGGAVAFALLLCFGYAEFDASAKKSRSSRKTTKTVQTKKHKKKPQKKTAQENDSVWDNTVSFGVVNQEGCDDPDRYVTVTETVQVVPIEKPVYVPEQPRPQEARPEPIYTAVEKPALFPGGQNALKEWLISNLRYPESAKAACIQGRVIVKFVVNKDGSIEQASVVRSIDRECDKEVLRLVERMPNWIPGKNNGVPVRSYFTLPISFKLEQ